METRTLLEKLRDALPSAGADYSSAYLGCAQAAIDLLLSTALPKTISSTAKVDGAVLASDTAEVRRALLDVGSDTTIAVPAAVVRTVYAVPLDSLGGSSAEFMAFYGTKYPLYTGAMAKGIASAEMVIAGGTNGMLCSFGAGGLPLHLVSSALEKIQAALPNGPYAVNLIHSPFDESLEKGNVDLFLARGVRVVEASAFMKLTVNVVRYRVAGLEKCPTTGKAICHNKIIFKVSRTELAGMALGPPPDDLVAKCLAAGHVTAEQAELAKSVGMCDDLAVEADSGGHTDNRPMPVLLPVILSLRDQIAAKTGVRVRVGAGGGIGCPEAAAAAFAMGADFILTGTINQMCREAGTCDDVRQKLSQAVYSDVVMAPAADMFDQGVELQVLKKGTMFPARSKTLYELFVKYPSLDAVPPALMARLEKSTFCQPVGDVWKETARFYSEQLKDPEKIAQAEADPKLKMSLVFRWYLSKSSNWANRGIPERKLDYQIWCGPAIGSFNGFIKGTHLDPAVSGSFMGVHEANVQVLRGAQFLRRCAQVKADPSLRRAVDAAALAPYRPQPL